MYITPFRSLASQAIFPRAENSTALAEIGWVREPRGRGTFSIIRSCIVTLALCVYTAIHLNLPARRDSKWTIYLRKTKWVIIALFAPELIVYFAWCQRRKVTRLHRDILEAIEDFATRYPGPKRQNPWTMTHSWYAYMGGFTIDTKPDPDYGDDIIIEDSPEFVLRKEGLILLAQEGYLPDMDQSYIEDKSKADWFAKLLAILEATWMVIQCSKRWSSGLFVTGLELSTLAHAICALMIFILWWNKPHDTQSPTKIEKCPRSVAAILWATRCTSEFGDTKIRKEFEFNQQISYKKAFPDQEALDCYFIPLGSSNRTVADDGIPMDMIYIYHPETNSFTPRAFQAPTSPEKSPTLRLNVYEAVVLSDDVALGIDLRERLRNRAEDVLIDRSFLVRWRLIWDFLQDRLDDSSNFMGPPLMDSSPEGMRYAVLPMGDLESGKAIALRIGNWCWTDPRHSIISFSIFFVCAITYSGIHGAAWFQQFPTSLESTLWRASCVYIGVFGIAAWVLVLILNFDWNRASLDSWTGFIGGWFYIPEFKDVRPLLFWSQAIMLGIFGLAYILARGYLVVEGFLSLRRLPESAYDTPDWSRYVSQLL